MAASILFPCPSFSIHSSTEHLPEFRQIGLSGIEEFGMLQKGHDRIWNGQYMNDSFIMNQSQSIGISARGRPLGCGHALALGPSLGPGRRRPGALRAAAWAQARAQGPGAQGMRTAQGPASSTDADALALIHDDAIIHISVIPNPVMAFLKQTKFFKFLTSQFAQIRETVPWWIGWRKKGTGTK